jgi:hypothetical protein
MSTHVSIFFDKIAVCITQININQKDSALLYTYLLSILYIGMKCERRPVWQPDPIWI